MKTPPKNQPDEGEAEKRLPFASATLMLVVSGDGVWEPEATGAAGERAGGRNARWTRRSTWGGLPRCALGSNFHGSPGRIELSARSESIWVRRAAAYGSEGSPAAGTLAKSGSP